VDSYFKTTTNEIRNAVSSVFERDPVTKRIKWVDGPIDEATNMPKKVPVFKQHVPNSAIANLQLWLASHYDNLKLRSDYIHQAAKAWFYNALLGSGKFHGDTHAGNLIVSANNITFIDFGNLFKLTEHPNGVNEKKELLYVIMGAAFRNKNFFLQGFENLMSAEGKKALAKNREKAEAILDSILSPTRGAFSFNIVYRLQAAIIELQKLGLELPPQINCFIQSMVRLSNTLAEMNTIMNQSKALLEATNQLRKPGEQRDELDLIGKIFDVFLSDEGKELVPASDNAPKGKKIPRYAKILNSQEYGGVSKPTSKMFKKDGIYMGKVVSRLTAAEDPIAAATKLVETLKGHLDLECSVGDKDNNKRLTDALEQLKTEYAKAKTDEDKQNAFKDFANEYTSSVQTVLSATSISLSIGRETKLDRPKLFANAITSILFENFNTVKQNFSVGDQLTLGSNASNIAYNELKLGYWESFSADKVVQAIIEDSNKMGGDKSYQVDIGV
jgi:hypothetical protein